MKRRELLLGLGAASLSGCEIFGGSPQLDFSLARSTEVHIDTRKRRAALRDDMLGLSFDVSALIEPRLLTAENPQLIGLLNGLGQHGVIRLGGRSTDQGIWLPNGGKLPKPYRYGLTTSNVDRLANLIDSSGWSLIYGLDLGHGDPARAADEAAYVYSRIGKRVLAFELGNAPDRYTRDKLRPVGYDVSIYISEWKRYAAAIRAKLANAPLGGPNSADLADPAWTEAFVKAVKNDLQLVSTPAYSHEAHRHRDRYDYGALTGSVFGLSNEQEAGLDRIAATARLAGLPYRITEARAVEDPRDGDAGVDTLGAALWAIDLFYKRCGDTAAPWAGICFHNALQLSATGTELPLRSGPLYYALRLLALTLPAHMVASSVMPPTAPGAAKGSKPAHTLLRAHALLDQRQRLRLVLINPDGNNSVDVRVSADQPLRGGTLLRLAGPALDAGSQVTLASGSTDAHGNWQPVYTDSAQINSGDAYLTVSAGSAVLLQFE